MVEVIAVMIWVLESIDIKRAVSRRFEAALRTVNIIEFGVFPFLFNDTPYALSQMKNNPSLESKETIANWSGDCF